MNHRRSYVMNDRGAAPIKMIIAVALIGAAIFAAWQLVPIYLDHFNFEDDVDVLIKFAFVNIRASSGEQREQKIVSAIAKMLNDMEVQYKTKDIKVQVDEGRKKIKVEVWYSRAHKLPFYPNPKQFYVNRENKPIEDL